VQDFAIFQRTDEIQRPMQIWFDVGTREWNYYVPFQERLLDDGWSYGQSLWYYEVKDGAHTASDWTKRIRFALRALFGSADDAIQKINVELEVFPSQTQKGVFFQRVNPVVTCANGLKYSLASAATYQVLDASAGTVQRDGRFAFLSTKDIPVRVTYASWKVDYTIRYRTVQSMKKTR
jgi:hypothetical protein